jgi:hypothetical protein
MLRIVIDQETLDEVSTLIARAEERLLGMVAEGRVGQEPDITSRLVHGVELASDAVDGVAIQFTVVDGIGPGAAERQLGADVLGVVRIELDELRIAKGFLAQSKRSGADGLRLRSVKQEDYSHWLYRGALQLAQSGVVDVTRPSAKLDEQCENMLKASPASFVLVFGREQVGVVSASAVHAHRASQPRRWKSLGTKRLDDFFMHILDCFVGDPALAAGSIDELRVLAAQRGASAAMMMRVAPSVAAD